MVMVAPFKLYFCFCNFAPCRQLWSVIFMSVIFMSGIFMSSIFMPAISCPAISYPAILMVRHFHVQHFQSTPAVHVLPGRDISVFRAMCHQKWRRAVPQSWTWAWTWVRSIHGSHRVGSNCMDLCGSPGWYRMLREMQMLSLHLVNC